MSALLVDAEVMELLRESPDLLAVADAITATQPARRAAVTPRFLRFAAVAAVVAVAIVAALVSPWQGRGSGFVARALAALGNGQVIHVVSVSRLPNIEVVDVQSGSTEPIRARTEIWFDGARGLERTVSSIGGRKTGEVVQTPDGTWSDTGIVYTCAWIAAHPVQATKSRVSCNAKGLNGTKPRHVPEPLPTLSPTLSGFVSGYREALQSGEARRNGTGAIDGRQVEWLRFERTEQGPPGAAAAQWVERVAVDAQTLKPVLVETSVGGQVDRTEIAEIETLAPQDAEFARPKETPPAERPVATSVKSKRSVSLAEASAALEGRLVWAGASLDGLPFAEAVVQEIVTGYGESSGVPFTHSSGVEMRYGGAARWDSPADYVLLRQSLRPEMLYGFAGSRQPLLEEGHVLVSSSEVFGAKPGTTTAVPTGKRIWRGILVRGGIYLAIETTSRTLLLDAARQLTPRASR